MISEIRLENARVFEGPNWKFPLSDLTVLCGTNSAGKSTILKTLLLLKQNITARPETSSKRMKLRFSGPQIDLGNFRSFISHRDMSNDLAIGLSFTNVFTSSSLTQVAQFTSLNRAENGTYLATRYRMHCDFRFGIARPGPQLSMTQIEKPDTEGEAESSSEHEAFLKEATFNIEDAYGRHMFRYELKYISSIRNADAGYELKLPRAFQSSSELANASDIFDESEEFFTIQTSLRGLLPDRLSTRVAINEPVADAPVEFTNRYWPLPAAIEETLNDLRRTLNLLAYIGPLRAPAERYYMGQPDYNLGSDTTGKSLPHLLRDRLDSYVEFQAPNDFTPMKMTLGAALDYWLYYFRTGEISPKIVRKREINIGSYQDILVELNIRSQNGQETHALADSGFGYSQLLPILVRGLLLPGLASIAIEQPEAHLNPALQARLAEFLMAVATARKQVFIETHSEHIVNYLRARTAENPSLRIQGGCVVLYMEPTQTVPIVHDLCIAVDGSIPAWPNSFFGDSSQLSARILRAQRQHRQKEDSEN
jgi:hypothetical protein